MITSSPPELSHELLMLAKTYDAGQSWNKAFKDTIEHVLLVVGNNPGKSLKEILLRPDVKEAMSDPFVTAGTDTIEAVLKAWSSATGDEVPITDLNATIKNVRKNTKSAPTKIRATILQGPRDEIGDRLKKLAKDMQLRAEYAVQFADKQGKTLKLVHDAPDSATKTWTATDPQCSACKALTGTTIGVKEEFSLGAGGLKLGAFGKLLGPPRHPNCHCGLKIS